MYISALVGGDRPIRVRNRVRAVVLSQGQSLDYEVMTMTDPPIRGWVARHSVFDSEDET